ncbi:MAG: hypothetical protein KDA65_04980 [Planctomycetaceae bacterium]|nr:hypothetical protein [Planctomycetaceae bacterium]
MVKRFFKSRWVRYPFFLILAVVLFVKFRTMYYHYLGQEVIVSKETTYLDEPLIDAETLDYVTALDQIKSEGVTPENNAAVPLMQAFGPQYIEKPDRPDFFARLGMSVPPEEGNYLISMDEYEATVLDSVTEAIEQFEEHQGKAGERMWSREEFPDLADWITQNEIPLDLVHEGLARERFFVPSILPVDTSQGRLIARQLPVQQYSRVIARLLLARATLAMQEGRVDAALRDLLDLHRLAMHLLSEKEKMGHFVGIAHEAFAAYGEEILLSSGKLTVEQIEFYQQELERLPQSPTMIEVIDFSERLSIIDSMIQITYLLMENEEEPKVLKQLNVPAVIDINQLLRKTNESFDGFIDTLKNENYAERIKSAEAFEESLLPEFSHPFEMLFWGYLSREYSTDLYGDILLGLFMAGTSAAENAWGRGESRRQLLQIALELEKYRLREGAFPDNLDPLSDVLPAKTFIDYFSGEPLVYKHEDNGYILYSIGPDLIDDDGTRSGPRGIVDGKLSVGTFDDVVIQVELKRKPAIAE